MKKNFHKKTLVALTLVLVCIMFLTMFACEKKDKDDKQLYEIEFVTKSPLSSVIELPDMGELELHEDTLFLFKDTSDTFAKYVVYDLEAGKAVKTFADDADSSYDLSIEEVCGTAIVVAKKTTAETTETTLYDKKGTAFVNTDEQYPQIDSKFDLLKFNKDYYRYSKGTGEFSLIKRSELSKDIIDDLTDTDGKYYYNKTSDGKIFAYDAELNFVSEYKSSTVATEQRMNALGVGKYIIQYLVQVPAVSEDYDIFMEDKKYNLVTEIYEAESGNVNKIEISYWFYIIVAKSLYESYDLTLEEITLGMGNAEVMAYALPIVDKGLESNDQKYLELDENGNVKSVISDMFKGMRMPPEVVAQGKISFETTDGREFLATDRGEVIGEITNAIVKNSQYIVGDSKIYDYSLNAIYDFGKEGMSYRNKTDKGLLFEKDEECYFYCDGEMKTIIKADEDKEVRSINSDYYVVLNNADSTYSYYSADGKLLKTGASELHLIKKCDGAILFGANEDGKEKYYRFS